MQPLIHHESLEPGAFETRIVALKHRLHELDWFSDEGLAEIIERHPRHALSICGMRDRNKEGWTEGRHDGLSGAQILDSLQRGRFWLNVREIYQHQPAFKDLVDQLYREMEQVDPLLSTQWRNATLLISSPTAFVNFHLDVPCNLLWHIRGVKRVWIYPRDEESVVTRPDLFATIAQEQTEMLHYDPAMDERAMVSDMQPGDMFSWPQHSPHRVDNIEGLNVSLSTEHLTTNARRRIRVLQANHFLRTRLGVAALDERTDTVGAMCKRAGATGFLALRKLLGRRPQGKKGYPVTFKLDPAAPEARVEL
ncbi:MAG: cupin-like domain-containing protein [Planctomycetales bacterium]|nr:cupin-like domain-containing protein [Planctomycetales bacterium]